MTWSSWSFFVCWAGLLQEFPGAGSPKIEGLDGPVILCHSRRRASKDHGWDFPRWSFSSDSWMSTCEIHEWWNEWWDWEFMPPAPPWRSSKIGLGFGITGCHWATTAPDSHVYFESSEPHVTTKWLGLNIKRFGLLYEITLLHNGWKRIIQPPMWGYLRDVAHLEGQDLHNLGWVLDRELLRGLSLQVEDRRSVLPVLSFVHETITPLGLVTFNWDDSLYLSRDWMQGVAYIKRDSLPMNHHERLGVEF